MPQQQNTNRDDADLRRPLMILQLAEQRLQPAERRLLRFQIGLRSRRLNFAERRLALFAPLASRLRLFLVGSDRSALFFAMRFGNLPARRP